MRQYRKKHKAIPWFTMVMSADDPEPIDDAEAVGQPAGGNDSPTDVLSDNQEYLKETISVYAAVGLGLGLSLFLLGQAGSFPITVSAGGMVEASGATGIAHDGVVQSLSFVELYLIPLLVIGVAAMVAIDADGRFEEPRDGLISGAVASLVGAVALTLIAGVLFSLELPSDLTEIAGSNLGGVGGGVGGGGVGDSAQSAVSIGMDWVNLVLNGLMYGIAAAVTTGTIAYARMTFSD